MTLRLLEKFVTSEVENLHLRIDELAVLSEKIQQRLDTVERQLSLLWLSIDELRQDVKYIKENFATKADLNVFATKADLDVLATKADLEAFATKADLEAFATKADLEGFATKADLKVFATKDDLRNFATKADLQQFATRSDLVSFESRILKAIEKLRPRLA